MAGNMESKKFSQINNIRSIANLSYVNHSDEQPIMPSTNGQSVSFGADQQEAFQFLQRLQMEHHLQQAHQAQQLHQQQLQQAQQQLHLQQQAQQPQHSQQPKHHHHHHHQQRQIQQLPTQQHQNHLQQNQLQIQPYHNKPNTNGTTSNHLQLNHPLQQSPRNSIIIQNGTRHNSSINSTNSTNSTSSNHQQTPKKELIDLLTCKLCKGYLIDAATLDLCMHTFCRPCAVKFIREEPRCPECKTAIKDKRYLNRLKTDVTMQNIVYKLVPGLYEKEMARRRKFYDARPVQPPRYKSEMFGDIPPSKTIKPDDLLNVCITPAWNRDCQEEDEQIKSYFYCRADSTMLVIRKLILTKFGLDKPIKIYYGNSEVFFDLTTLMDVAFTFNWSPESKILNLSFNEEEKKKIPVNSSHPPSSDHGP